MKDNIEEPNDDLRAEYSAEDLRNGVRGKYYERYRMGTNLVLLAPDVAAAFPSEEAVNAALRSLMEDKETPFSKET